MTVRQRVAPLDYKTPIVNPQLGTPTLQYIQLFQRLYGNEELTAEELAGLTAALAALEATVTALEADVAAVEADIVILEAAKVPTGGATGEVLTKDSGTDYDMSWQPASGGGAIYAPLVTGGLPGPELVATGDGQCIMVEIG